MNWLDFLRRMLRFRLSTMLVVATATAGITMAARYGAREHGESLPSLFAVAVMVYVLAAAVFVAKGLIAGSISAGRLGARVAGVGLWMLITLPMLMACAYAASQPVQRPTVPKWRSFDVSSTDLFPSGERR
ncbi:MAG: hypothetical protein KDA42_01420 [Planctomycetales bacterium]|nr:hypothetical protein [Planctomycetales bacterium]